jgi:hypothetical protein
VLEASDHAYVTLASLKERGWTNALVNKFLGDPDDTRANRYSRSAPIRLYKMERVSAVEMTPDWQIAKAKSAKRSATARERANRQGADLFAHPVLRALQATISAHGFELGDTFVVGDKVVCESQPSGCCYFMAFDGAWGHYCGPADSLYMIEGAKLSAWDRAAQTRAAQMADEADARWWCAVRRAETEA